MFVCGLKIMRCNSKKRGKKTRSGLLFRLCPWLEQRAAPVAELFAANYNSVTSVWAAGSLKLRDLGGAVCFPPQYDMLTIHANKPSTKGQLYMGTWGGICRVNNSWERINWKCSIMRAHRAGDSERLCVSRGWACFTAQNMQCQTLALKVRMSRDFPCRPDPREGSAGDLRKNSTCRHGRLSSYVQKHSRESQAWQETGV